MRSGNHLWLREMKSMGRSTSAGLPDIFPELGPATRAVLFADFTKPQRLPDDEQWRNECQTILDHGLAGIALRLVREPLLNVPADVVAAFQRRQFGAMELTATTVRQSAPGLEILRSAGIPFVVTKGPGIALNCVARTDRPFIDIDVIVGPSKFQTARTLLAGDGYRELVDSTQPWSAFDRHCREAVNLRDAHGGSIDLHHRISPWYWSSGLRLDLLSRSSRVCTMFGIELPVVSNEHNLLITALHVVSDKNHPGQTLRVWRDLLVLARCCAANDVVNAAEQTGLTAWLAWIIECLPSDVRPRELWGELQLRQNRIRGGGRIRLLLPPHIGARHVLGQVFRLPVPNGALFAAGMVVPSPGFLRRRLPGERHPYLTWWRASIANVMSDSDGEI